MSSSTTAGGQVSATNRPDASLSSTGSKVVQVNPTTRVGRLVALQGLSREKAADGSRKIDKTFLYNSAAAFLAAKHFNERRGLLLPWLPRATEGCDFYFAYEFRDTHMSGYEAVRQLALATGGLFAGRGKGTIHILGNTSSTILDTDTSIPNLEPAFIYGAYWSSSTKPLSILSTGLGLPQISGASTSAELDTISPFFARTVATNQGDARAAMLYYQSIGVTHLAVLFIKDSWGTDYHAFLQRYASNYGITILSLPYVKGNVESALGLLKKNGIRHVFGILHDWSEVIPKAHAQELIGRSDYAWMVAETKEWTGSAFQLSIPEEAHLAQAYHGIGTLNLHFEESRRLTRALQELATDKQLQQEYIDTMVDPTLFDEYEFPGYDPISFANSIFDAVLALGLAACQTPNPLFTAEEFFHTLVNEVQFEGVSGRVAFDNTTGNRQTDGLKYSIEYVVVSDKRTTQDAIRFESGIAAIVSGDGNMELVKPFIYHDNTTNVPASLPPLEHDLHLVTQTNQIIGFVLASVALLSALLFLIWTILNRNRFVVRASQPIFLVQLCIGIIIMALSVFPASLPGASPSFEATPSLNAACMSQLWLLFSGFVTAFSSIFAKTYRLNQIMNSGHQMRRIKVDPKDVMGPFIILLLVNTTMLLCITFVSPYNYERVEMELAYDRFGRSTESYGTCRPDRNIFYGFMAIMATTNATAVGIALYQSWKARNLPTEFSESYYLGLAVASFTETCILSVPILAIVYDNPDAWFLLCSATICVICLTIMTPIMLPKYLANRQNPSGIDASKSIRMSVARCSQRDFSSDGISGMSVDRSGPLRSSDPFRSSDSVIEEPSARPLGRGQMAVTRNKSEIIRASRRSSASYSTSMRSSRNIFSRFSQGNNESEANMDSSRLRPSIAGADEQKSAVKTAELQASMPIRESIEPLQHLSSGISCSSSQKEEEETKEEVEAQSKVF